MGDPGSICISSMMLPSGIGNERYAVLGAAGERPAMWMYVHIGQVRQRLFQIVHLQTEVLITDCVRWMLYLALAVGEQLDKLSLGKL